MADNVFYTDPGTGTTFATDDVAGVHYQKVKLFDGTADSTTAIVAGNGTAAGALRVTLASDTTGVVGLAAGTNAIGKLAANDGVDIGDVTINNASIPVTGTFWQATQPVSIASVPSHDVTNAGTFAVQLSQYTPASGRLPVDGSGVTQPVSIAAAVAVTDNAGSLTVDAPVATPVFVRLSDGAAAISTLPVSLASVPSHPVTNAGTFPVQSSGDVAHDTGDSGSPVKVGGRADTVRDFATAVTAGDRTNFATDLYGRQKVSIYPDDVKRLGVYYYHSGALTVTAAADSAATSGGGRVWIQNPTSSSVTMRIRKIIFKSQLGSALVAVTSPRFTIEKCVFTGTASGASITAAKRRTADASAGGSGRTAVTGMTISSAAVVCSFFPVASATAVAYCSPTQQVFDAGLEDYIDLAPGELIVLRQADAGTTSDTRRVTCDFIVEEF